MGPPMGLAPGAQGGAEQAVHDEVRVAADGRGKVRVAWAREREVALVLLAVAGLLE